jgi:hypothetical protein
VAAQETFHAKRAPYPQRPQGAEVASLDGRTALVAGGTAISVDGGVTAGTSAALLGAVASQLAAA